MQDLAPNTRRVYLSKLRRIMRAIPNIVREDHLRQAIRDKLELERKLGVKAEDVMNVRLGRSSRYENQIEVPYAEYVTSDSITAEEASANALDEMINSAKVVHSINAIKQYEGEIAALCVQASRAPTFEEAEKLVVEAKAVNDKLPANRKKDDQINEVLEYRPETKERRAREFASRPLSTDGLPLPQHEFEDGTDLPPRNGHN